MLREQDGLTYYTNIFTNEKSVRMCSPEKIYKIDVREAREDEETPYVGWLDNEGNISLIFRNITLFKVCFTYGYKAEEDVRRGRMIRIFVEEINDKNN